MSPLARFAALCVYGGGADSWDGFRKELVLLLPLGKVAAIFWSRCVVVPVLVGLWTADKIISKMGEGGHFLLKVPLWWDSCWCMFGRFLCCLSLINCLWGDKLVQEEWTGSSFRVYAWIVGPQWAQGTLALTTICLP